MNPIIEVNSLTRKFSSIKVVDDVSFSVDEGEMLGLLGPNGAGKTTTIKMLTGLVRPTSGHVTIGGYDLRTHSIQAKRLFDISPQDASLHPHLSISEDLYFYARLRGLPRSLSRQRAKEALEWANLVEHADKNGFQLSGGMQRRLLMARALMTDPPVLFLDEPTTGLDPQSRHALWECISELGKLNKTIILTTHYMEEAEMLCGRIIIMDNGKIIADGTPTKLKEIIGVRAVLTLKPRRTLLAEDFKALKKTPGIRGLESSNGCIKLFLTDRDAIDSILSIVLDRFGLKEINFEEPSLEDVFLGITGKELRE